MAPATEASVESVIAGHPRYACRVYYHEALGHATFDTSVIVDRRIDEEYDYRPGMFGVSEAVFCVAEEEAWEALEA